MPDDHPVSGSFYHPDMKPAEAVADATSAADVVARFNALLAALRAAGILAEDGD